jgi:hypothetical protein
MNKFLEKIAVYADGNKALKTLVKRYLGNTSLRGLQAGAVLGGGAGYAHSSRDHTKKDRYGNLRVEKATIGDKIGGTTRGAIYGGLAGGYIGSAVKLKSLHKKMGPNYRSSDSTQTKHGKKFWDTIRKANGKNPSGGSSYSKHRDISSILKDLEAPSGGFKTKTEATHHFRKASMRYHPDRAGGSNEAMSRVNSAYREYKAHPAGFEKLAGLGILDTIYDN